MILQALYDYYNRCDVLPQYGRELKEIGFLIVIDKDGNFKRLEDRRIDKRRAQQFLVKKSVQRSNKPRANYLYDNSKYVLGIPDSNENLLVFKNKVNELYELSPDNDNLKAVHMFYKMEQNEILDCLQKDILWDEVSKNLGKKYSLFSFLIEGDTEIIATKEELLDLESETSNGLEKRCLITGEKAIVAETTTATMIPGSQATAKLVSFQKFSGYDSYGKEQGFNAPISVKAEFAYTTALKHMLSSDSRNKFMIGSRTFVFWASKANEAGSKAEEGIFSMFGFDQRNDDPNRGIEQVRDVFYSIYSGQITTNLDDKFYILGLAPNSARIAVTYWAELPLREFAELIVSHFDDMEIIDNRKEKKPYMSLRSILGAVTLNGKVSDCTPNLPEGVVKSIFQGIAYPHTLYASCIRRIRAEQSIGVTRAAIIKAYLNRTTKTNEIKVMLDKNNHNQGYLCGRLFAVLDKIQQDANNQHTIRERYMNAASATPATVFSTIMNLSYHHSEKLNEGSKIFFEKIKQEIVDKISADGFPSHLSLQDQGRFFVGYYHQQQDFYNKKETTDKE